MKAGAFAKRYKISNGRKFRLKDFDPGDSGSLESKEEAAKHLKRGVRRMAALQDKLYAQDRWGVLLIFQAMDAAGKDGTIKHVMSGLNPQGCQVFSFKVPSPKSWTTISCGGPRSASPSGAGSGSSTGRTTRKCWSSGSTRSSWSGRSCRRNW